MAGFEFNLKDGKAVVALAGDYDMNAAEALKKGLDALPEELKGAREVTFDFSKVERLEPNCAYLFLEAAKQLRAQGAKALFANVTPDQESLLKALSAKSPGKADEKPEEEMSPEFIVVEVGEATITLGRDSLEILSFFGEVMLSLWQVIKWPDRLRVISIFTHIERAGLNAVPIVCLMSFLIGGIIAQQGAFQLRKYGADLLVVNLTGILVLRELGVLLAAIMFAGRSGSAYTAEIGSMKMREEIDAMRVMGLSPIEVLALPRLIALVIALPLVTVLSDLSALFGGMLVCWGYVDIAPANFISQIQSSVPVRHAFIGIVKAPFMAIIIGIIACIEGLRVRGSAESLGTHTTSSVVKSIFMVIVVDGIFATIFTAMDL
jgi:phospholipid/cholesterol/gamma-HCH transport system permease protein